jgi:hypothetical protein
MHKLSLPSLKDLAAERDHITTAEFARTFCVKAQTVRKNYCLDGHCFDIRPIKVGNRLLWPVAAVSTRLSGEAAR